MKMSLVRKISLLIFATSIVINYASSQSQQSKYPTLWNAFISIGYANATSGNVNEYYNLIVDSYRRDGIPLSTQTPFGRTLVLNGGVLLTRLENIWFGFSFGYLYSPAYSNYRDYAGTLKVNGFIDSYEISIMFKATLIEISGFPITLSSRPGILYTSSFITQEGRFFNFPQDNYDWKWSANDWGPSAQATMGTSVLLGKLILSFDVGYRFAWNTVQEEKIESSYGNRNLFEPWNIGPSGIVSFVSLEMRL